jgi:anthranilate phosphoribosyltransferase
VGNSLTEQLLDRGDLTAQQAGDAVRFLLDPSTSDVGRAALLTAWRSKGYTGEELAGGVAAVLERSVRVDLATPNLVDTCGTGGGPAGLNLSTGAALVAAAAGARVAKHGNRSVSSACGSADVLEAWGVRLDAEEAQMRRQMQAAGVTFLFAPHHHPAFRAVGPVRKELGFRTIFNLMGPLSNPAGAPYRLVGVYDDAFLEPMAQALILLGVERAAVVHAADGMDEVSPTCPTAYVWVESGVLRRGQWTPSDFGMEPLDRVVYGPPGTVAEAAQRLRQALAGEAAGAALVPNAAVTLVLAGVAPNLAEAASLVRSVLADGTTLATLEALVATE